jgi:hypothetical protein
VGGKGASCPQEALSGMTHDSALFSLVFMMGFVVVFENSHSRRRSSRILRSINFLSSDEISRLQAIWQACQEP